MATRDRRDAALVRVRQRCAQGTWLSLALATVASPAAAEPRAAPRGGPVARDRGPAPASAEVSAQDALGFGPAEATPEAEPVADPDALGFGGGAGAGAPAARPEPADGGADACDCPDRRLHVGGVLRSQAGLWTEALSGDTNPLAKARQTLDLTLRYRDDTLALVASGHAEYDAAYLWERSARNPATLATYESLVDVRETYLAARVDWAEVSFGRQYLVLGAGDLLSPLDQATPRDQREPGLSNPEDLRLPVLMSRLELFLGYHRLELALIHEGFYGYRPTPFGPFSPLPAVVSSGPTAPLLGWLGQMDLRWHEPDRGIQTRTQQATLRWAFSGPAVDLGFALASLRDQLGTVVGLEPPFTQPVAGPRGLVLEHQRYYLAGTYGALPFLDFVLKWELAYAHQRAFNVGAQPSGLLTPTIELGDFATAMGGLTFSGIPKLVLVAEASTTVALRPGTLVQDTRATLMRLGAPLFATRLQLQPTQDWTFEATATGMGARLQYGFLLRFGIQYALGHGLGVSLTHVRFLPGQVFGPLAGLDAWNRLDLGLRWDFLLH